MVDLLTNAAIYECIKLTCTIQSLFVIRNQGDHREWDDIFEASKETKAVN